MEVKLGQPPYALGSNGVTFVYRALLPGLPFPEVNSEFQPHAKTYSRNKLVVVYHYQLVSTPNSLHGELQQCKQTVLHLFQDFT